MNNTNDLLTFFAILERQAVSMAYGTMTVNVVLQEGSPKLETLNIVKSKRRKYNADNAPVVEISLTELVSR